VPTPAAFQESERVLQVGALANRMAGIGRVNADLSHQASTGIVV